MSTLNVELLKKNIESTSHSDIQSGRVGGIAVSVMQNGETVYQDYFGDERLGISVSEKTLFRLASMTKPISTIAALKLVESNEIALDDPVFHYIPEFEHMNIGRLNGEEIEIVGPAKRHITIRHILTHTSGLGSGPVGDMIAKHFPTAERFSLEHNAHHYANQPLDFEPYSKQAYSGTFAFDVLGRIVEIVTGMKFGAFVQKEVLLPLGMTDTGFAPSPEQWSRMIPMHNYVDGSGIIANYPKTTVFHQTPTECCAAGTAMASTIYDYKIFADMLLNLGYTNGKQIIKEDLVREMIRPQLPPHIMSGQQNWGLGVRIITAESGNTLPYGSFGWSGALGGHFWIDPTNRIVAIYLKNSRYDGGAGSRTGKQFEQDVYASLTES